MSKIAILNMFVFNGRRTNIVEFLKMLDDMKKTHKVECVGSIHYDSHKFIPLGVDLKNKMFYNIQIEQMTKLPEITYVEFDALYKLLKSGKEATATLEFLSGGIEYKCKNSTCAMKYNPYGKLQDLKYNVKEALSSNLNSEPRHKAFEKLFLKETKIASIMEKIFKRDDRFEWCDGYVLISTTDERYIQNLRDRVEEGDKFGRVLENFVSHKHTKIKISKSLLKGMKDIVKLCFGSDSITINSKFLKNAMNMASNDMECYILKLKISNMVSTAMLWENKETTILSVGINTDPNVEYSTYFVEVGK